MTFGEEMYLGLVVTMFFVFGITLATVASRTSRFVRQKATDDAARQPNQEGSKKAA